jgi:hypothetical protein
MVVKIKGRKWSIREADLDDNFGECHWEKRLIKILRGQCPQERLDTLIHEVIHAVDEKLSEKKVFALANVITAVLWMDGYRRKKKRG